MSPLIRLISPLVFALIAPALYANQKLRRGWAQRLGRHADGFDEVARPRIWLHGASAGDLMALQPVIHALRAQRPELGIVVSSMTESGQEMAKARLTGIDRLIYVPWDVPFAVRGALRAVRPDVLVLEYTELWPNLIHEASSSGVRLVLTNGRIGARNLRGYRRLFGVLGNPLKRFDRLLMRSRAEADRATELGASPFALRITGNTKYDNLEAPSEERVEALRSALQRAPERLLWVCGSTHEGEEADLIQVYKELTVRHRQLDLLIAPRYVERAERVAELARSAGLSVAFRSQHQGAPGGVTILDRIGELMPAYALADVVFVGGSFIERGGQNILEPAACGKPVLFGPHMENFVDEVGLLVGRGGIQVGDRSALLETIDQLLYRAGACAEVGALARESVTARAGAGQACARHILALVESP
ncbi:MAG: glycosyltransferase N-terminal domain-containing protein [Myxococcota bacterium]|nr:glycosyltransferase N-terminal domain-containing protein [Myxococcota bacterium]